MNSADCFSKLEIDAIGEILNISLGASATAVSTMLNARVDITTPIVNVVRKEEFEMDRVDPAVCVEITYVAGLEGRNVMLLKRHDIKVIVEMAMGMEIADEDFELDEINISAVCEVMNQMMGASATALSEFLGRVVDISTPVSFEVENKQQFIEKYFTDEEPKVLIGFTLKIADKLESEFFNVMPIRLAKGLVEGFLPPEDIVPYVPGGSPAADSVPEPVAEPAPAPEPEPAPMPDSSANDSSGGKMSQEEIERMLAGMMGDEPTPEPAAPEPAPAPAPVTQAPEPAPAPAAPASAPAPAPAPVAPTPAAQAPAADPMAGAAAQPTMMPVMQGAVQPMVSPDVAMMQMQMMQQMMQQMQQMQAQMQEQKPAPKAPPEPKMIHVQPPMQPNLKADTGIVLEGEQEENMELIMSVPLEVSVEIGRTKKLVKDILDFSKGSLVVLDKLAGEQVDLYVNGQCIAKGDVVVVEDNFGVRITEIMKVNLIALEQH